MVGVLLYQILKTSVLPAIRTNNGSQTLSTVDQETKRKAAIYTSLYLLNPMVFSISTRGSSESTIGALVVLTLYYMLSSPTRLDAAAVVLGIATHWKVYPFIYGASLLAVLGSEPHRKHKGGLWGFLRSMVNKKGLRFAILSFGTFMLLNAGMYLM